MKVERLQIGDLEGKKENRKVEKTETYVKMHHVLLSKF